MSVQISFENGQPRYTGTVLTSQLAQLLNDGSKFNIEHQVRNKSVSGSMNCISLSGSCDIVIGTNVDIYGEGADRYVEDVYNTWNEQDEQIDMQQDIYVSVLADTVLPSHTEEGVYKMTAATLLRYGIDRVIEEGDKLEGVVDIES